MQDQFLARLGMSDAAKRLGNSIGWAGVLAIVVAAAMITLAIGFAAYHFRMRYHAQQQIKEIMCAAPGDLRLHCKLARCSLFAEDLKMWDCVLLSSHLASIILRHTAGPVSCETFERLLLDPVQIFMLIGG